MNVLITGASAGFGKALAERLIANGHQVIGCARRLDKLNALAETLGEAFLPVAMDVSDTASIPQIIADLPDGFNQIDVLVNNAGLALGAEPAQRSNLDDWMRMTDTNVKGLMALTHAVLPAMVARDSGYVINVGSIAGSWPYFGGNVYGATKAAVIGMTKSVAADYVKGGIRCNCVCPGTVDTPSLHDRMAALGDIDEARKMFVARQPMGRLAKAEEIAPTVVFLASDESAFATGNAYMIDGGITI